MKITGKRIVLFAGLSAVIAAALYSFRPQPVPVETAPAAVGPLSASIEEEGRTRARDRFTVAAPTAGQLERVALRAGDPVARGQTVAALRLAPLDPRELEAARGKLHAAEALRREAIEVSARAAADAAQATRDRQRAEQLQQQGYIALQQLEQARSVETAALKGADAARFRVDAATSEVEVARAALLAGEGEASGERRRLPLRAPAGGRVLRVFEESARVVPAGTPILELGDPALLEVVIETLSTDAVQVRPGMPVRLSGWGGEGTLAASVRTIEPAAFTKVSALGIEEQRVNVVADLSGPPGPLGDGYRVEAAIVTWSADAVLKVPASSLFRRAAAGAAAGQAEREAGPGWAVFAVAERRARLRPVEVGHRTADEVEILGGIAAGELVVLHPANELRDGARVRER